MTDFFTITGRVREWAWCRVVGRPPSNTSDDSGTVRFNTIDWERRAKVAADARADIDSALESLKNVASAKYFDDLFEGIEVHNRLRALIQSWQDSLRHQANQLLALQDGCRSAKNSWTYGDSNVAQKFST